MELQPQPTAAGNGSRLRFSRQSRLLKHADFDRVYKSGRRHFGHHMTVFYLGRGDEKPARTGFTVGRALGGAVERNRIKRRLREAVRLHGGKLQMAVDVVINPKKSALQADFAELEREIVSAFATIGKKINAEAAKERKA
ncbi:MAG TPA: ribonuclease P protein component [Terriglobales bacterium]|nr:ribonuclease P protein component [Terriglobales bacterium]